MSAALEDITIDQGEHVVQFYALDSELLHSIGRYLSGGLQAGAAAIVIATEAHRDGLVAALTGAGLDPATERRDGTLILLDADATLASFMDDGEVDSDAFRHVIGTVVRRAGSGGRPVLAYGEMVAVLWEAGDVVAAIELEKAWNELAFELSFALVCGYRSESVLSDADADAMAEMCHLHSSVVNLPTRRSAVAAAGAEVSARFDPEHDAPRAARRFVTDVLRRWGHGLPLVEDAQLVATELATNAVVHARSQFRLAVRPHGSGVRLSVGDDSSATPTMQEPDPLSTSGRGLYLVATIAAQWGVEPTPGGKTVWAELQPPDARLP